jgi:recombinational DNA repair protein (RecF pathway)
VSISQFFLKNNLLIEEIFSLEFINKFLRFLKNDFTLSSNSTLKQIIDKIFREKEEKIQKDFNKINKDFVRTKSHTNKPINYNSYFDRYILDLLGFK